MGPERLISHIEDVGFCLECERKPLGGVKWENEKILWLPGAMEKLETTRSRQVL